LSTYALERVKLNTTIELDATETELDPQNPNPRGAHGTGEQEDPLELIIKVFNQRWSREWDAAPDDQMVIMVRIANKIRTHPDFKTKYADNPDSQNADIAFKQIFGEVMTSNRKNELDLYRLIAKDDSFRMAMLDTLKRVLGA
jgi:type I restriction enzyme R subunit